MLTISGKALGQRKPLFAEFSVPPPDEVAEGGSTTLRVFIEGVVRREVAAFRKRQADRQFIRALTARQIHRGVEAGKIESGGSEIEPQEVDEEQAVATAIEAFQDGMYLVVIDGEDHRNLDAQVFLQPDSRVTFVRLTLLAGG
ncbi:MAG: hypothetical protein ACYTG0_15440 [Planctomycetota bacterium]|jgi:hypothetical protein